MFESFIATRYLRAKQKNVVISVISVIAVVGVAAGVMAMIIALGITSGLSGTMEQMFLEASGHVIILERNAGEGIYDWRELSAGLASLEGVESVQPGLYDSALLRGPINSAQPYIKGILTDPDASLPSVLQNLKEGDLEGVRDPENPGIILGVRMAERIGAVVGKQVSIVIPNGFVTPMGFRPKVEQVYVAGIFESGIYEFDEQWAYMTLSDVQNLFGYGDVVNTIEMNIEDVYDAPRVAMAAEAKLPTELRATTWQEQNSRLLGAFQLERTVTAITIGMIQLVAALNILTVLTMMVMEKHRDIAILMSMGAKAAQIRRIFVYKGLIIGGAGTLIGMFLGYTLSYFADRGQWLKIDAEVYSVSYVPIHTAWLDGIWVAVFAMIVSFVATLYPASKAARIAPVESMRYE